MGACVPTATSPTLSLSKDPLIATKPPLVGLINLWTCHYHSLIKMSLLKDLIMPRDKRSANYCPLSNWSFVLHMKFKGLRQLPFQTVGKDENLIRGETPSPLICPNGKGTSGWTRCLGRVGGLENLSGFLVAQRFLANSRSHRRYPKGLGCWHKQLLIHCVRSPVSQSDTVCNFS